MRPHAPIRRALVAASASAALVLAVGVPAATASTTAPAAVVTAASSQTPEQQVFAQLNQERAKAGLRPLKASSSLNAAAEAWAAQLAKTGTFQHSTSAWRDQRLSPAGWAASGENIAAGYTGSNAAMSGWMNSSGHKANILNRSYYGVGVGYVKGGPYGHYWVTIFGIAKPTMKPSTPALSGTSKIGGVIRSTSSWPSGTKVTYQWRADGRNISGATARTMKVTAALQGKRLSVVVKGTNPSYFPTSVASRSSYPVVYP
jgi:uncharacterized protein YkwD